MADLFTLRPPPPHPPLLVDNTQLADTDTDTEYTVYKLSITRNEIL
jgi:hypothetical protein